MFNMFSGGALSRFTLFALGIMPYISASIIMQLMTMIFPALERMSKHEGELGRSRFNQYSRLLTVPLALLQGYSFLTLLTRQDIIAPLSTGAMLGALCVITAGSVLLMWIGEIISEYKLGNGVSLLILAGIVSALPTQIQQAAFAYSPDQLFTYIAFVLVGLLVIAGVVFISEAQRNIPITYARRVVGSKQYGGVSTYLPMRVNNAGVIPIIFALSLLLFPGILANIFAVSNIETVARVATGINNILQNTAVYSAFYFILVVAFTFFYTAIAYDPKAISETIQKQGGYIAGIRPGVQTAAFLQYLLNRVTLAGAIFLGVIAILPSIMQGLTGVTAFTVGGTSILIVVSVALETMKQLEAQLSVYEY
jgi:preprotein translocase subunit SecY